ncbi:MAG: hypothetical protein ABIQ70_07855 [Dokdonella sp.]
MRGDRVATFVKDHRKRSERNEYERRPRDNPRKCDGVTGASGGDQAIMPDAFGEEEDAPDRGYKPHSADEMTNRTPADAFQRTTEHPLLSGHAATL